MTLWPTHALEDLVVGKQISYGVVQPGQDSALGVPIIRVKDVRNGIVDTSNPTHVDPKIAARHSRTALEGGELLISIVGTVGETAIAPTAIKGWNVARAIAVIRPEGVSSHWLQLCFRTPTVQSTIDSMLNTTVQATLNLADLKRIKIPVPTASVRNAIEEVIGALDDKIAANSKLAETLAALTTAYFDLSAKSGQRSVPLSELVTTQYGVTTSSHNGPGPRLLRVTDINKKPWIEWSTAPFCTVGETELAKYKVNPGDILVARMADPGKAAFIDYGDPEAVFASYLVRLRVNDIHQALFIYYYLRSNTYRAYAEAAMQGSVQKNMNAKVIVAAQISVPGPEVLSQFNSIASKLRTKIQTVLNENLKLTEMRDALLPQLMSGNLSVKIAEKAVESVT